MMLIMIQQAELGITNLRNDNFFDINLRNPSLIWGPTDDLVFTIFLLFYEGSIWNLRAGKIRFF